jgi:hypothetical protein
MKTKFLILFTLACAVSVHAGPRGSTSGGYNIAAETTGLATAAAVYQETPATVSATRGGIPNQLTADLHVTARCRSIWRYGSH